MRNNLLSRCKCTWFCLVVLLCNPATALSTENLDSLTLKRALALTLAHNPQLFQYRFTTEALTAQKQSNSLRPALALELEVENFAGSKGYEGFDSAETTLALSSVIELGGKRQARLSYADARLNQAKWEQQAETLDVLGKLAELYIEGLATQANIQLAEESLVLSQSLLKTVKTRSARGATPEAEVMRAQAALTQAEIRLAALQAKFERQQILLARFWGETSVSFDVLEGSLFNFGATTSFEQLYARVQKSPAIQVLASEARIRDAQITLARANGSSDLSWRVGIKRLEETGDSAFVAGLSIPLFSGKRNSGEVETALAQRNAVDYAKKDQLLQLHARLFESWSLRKQSIAAVNLTQKSAIPALEKALKLTTEGFENGRYRYLDLIAAQKELLASKQSLIDAATTALVSQAVIEKLTSEALNP
ncbi:TolC family protein [Agaribacterium haliotis]|uniref:TolC family protein n=1 Tax=Agaribacterium haliotis TaxID=2013869 RepID=UPI000BB56978|nr:TolC family protein [Agaribacterium haliotis]